MKDSDVENRLQVDPSAWIWPRKGWRRYCGECNCMCCGWISWWCETGIILRTIKTEYWFPLPLVNEEKTNNILNVEDHTACTIRSIAGAETRSGGDEQAIKGANREKSHVFLRFSVKAGIGNRFWLGLFENIVILDRHRQCLQTVHEPFAFQSMYFA